MPINRDDYPLDWESISHRIRFERAGGVCECDGRCGHHDCLASGGCHAVHGQPHPDTGSMVWLTTAHLNHDTTDNRDKNLMAMCQRCHLNYDRKHHAINAARTRRQKQIDAGQLELTL